MAPYSSVSDEASSRAVSYEIRPPICVAVQAVSACDISLRFLELLRPNRSATVQRTAASVAEKTLRSAGR